jgi:hypothetical protein
VVYGDHWEDIEYFSSFHKARKNLVIQTRFKDSSDSSFHPFIIAYSDHPHDGTYGRTKNYLGIKKVDELMKFDELALKQNPEDAFHLIEMLF